MSKHQTPAGWHDADDAADHLGISKNILLEKMRALTWLGNDKKNPKGDIHNKPKKEFVHLGYLSTQLRSHGMRGEFRHIGHSYKVMLISVKGLKRLEALLKEAGEETTTAKEEKPMPVTPTKPQRITPPPSDCKGKAPQTYMSTNSPGRAACLDFLSEELGIHIDKKAS